MTITAMQLFDSAELSKWKKDILRSANKTAISLYRKRYSPHLKDNFDKPADQLTLEDVEKDVIKAILQKYHGYNE